ncbi:DUF4091 domain-containing protein [Paenibacillus sp. OK060]|uniref:DUF4091 domain-containing protein n=1 Tax=Paenibacillus sp. OK060 TaxID=1881034 RepID=UPI0021093B75|nr:DUF4091 domain-containing protein [Paenibacillus sp. OK060]
MQFKVNCGLQNMFYKYMWSSNWWNQGREDTQVKHLELRCCKNDSAAFQALVNSDQEDMLVTINRDALLWKGGPIKIVRCEVETDAPCKIDLQLIGLIEDDNRVMTSDVLLDEPYQWLRKRQIQPLWVELHADDSVVSGQYEGKLKFYTHTMFEDEVLEKELTFRLTISEQVLPEPQNYTFVLDLWQHNCNIARKYDVSYWSDEHFTLLDSYLHSLSQLGQKALTLVVSEEPWSGQRSFIDAEPSDLNEYSIVQIVRRSDGRFDYDFTHLDRYVEIGEKHGICKEIEVFGLINIWKHEDEGFGGVVDDYPDAIRVRYYDEETGSYKFIRNKSDLSAYVVALEQHFISKKWIDRVRVVADEPADICLFEESLACLREMAPSFLYKAAINHTEFIRKHIKGIVDYVPVLDCAAEEYEQLEQLRKEVKGTFTFYVCCSPEKPNTFLSSPSIESRVIPWLAEKLKLDGFLRWNYTVWPDKPLERLSYRPMIWKAGDTNFVYPGKRGKPLLSLRYKWLQRGIRDYEYMQIAKQNGQEEQVEKILQRVFRFDHPRELAPSSGKTAMQLYSFNIEDYDRLYEIENGQTE